MLNAIYFYRAAYFLHQKKIPLLPLFLKALTYILFNSVVPYTAVIGRGSKFAYGGIGVVVFSLFVAFDMQRIKDYPDDAYIDAALNLYLDIFNLFVYVLRFILSLSNND